MKKLLQDDVYISIFLQHREDIKKTVSIEYCQKIKKYTNILKSPFSGYFEYSSKGQFCF